LSYTKKIKVNQGVNRYFWNREFDSEAFDKQENDWIVNFFKENIKKDNTNALNTAYNRYIRANTPSAKRRIVQSLVGNTLIPPVDEKYGIQEAGPGLYHVEISSGAWQEKGQIVIKKDPMGN
jgi:hypothetical protein